MRIAGLASGLDIDSMVKELMKSRKASSEKFFHKRVTAEWQQEAYREVSAKIVDFRNNKLASYNLSSAMNSKKAEVSGNASAISVNSVNSTAAGSLNVQVTKVATVATSVFTSVGGSTDGKTLADLGIADGSMTINGKTVAYAATDTLEDLANRINADKDTKATALYDKATGKLSITNMQTGGGSAVAIQDGFLVDGTKFTRANSGGDNATAVINGISFTQSSNRFTANGIDFTVKAETGATNASVQVVTDTDKIMNTIKSFVSDYNSLLDKVNGELGKERFRTYSPLTDEQKEAMTEKQIELWEEKARSGLLRNDTILSQFASDLRIATTAEFSNKFNIDSIGISTGTWQERGKLVIDEDKLRAAIEADPQKVANLFTASGDASKPDNAGVGIFNKLSNIAMRALTDLSSKAGTSIMSSDPKAAFLENSLLSEQIRGYKTKESELAAKLKQIEDRYYKQFAAMEAAINKFNSQASGLSSFFS